jgi:hypothetical protein
MLRASATPRGERASSPVPATAEALTRWGLDG